MRWKVNLSKWRDKKLGKKITIQLIDWRNYKDINSKDDFRIEKITNTTLYVAGEFMSESVATDLCSSSEYEIKIREAKNSDFHN